MELGNNNLPYVHILKKSQKKPQTLISFVSSPRSSEVGLSFTVDMLVELFL